MHSSHISGLLLAVLTISVGLSECALANGDFALGNDANVAVGPIQALPSAQFDRPGGGHGGGGGRPGHGRPGHGRPDFPGRPDHGRPDHGRPDHGRPGHGRPDFPGRPDHGRPDFPNHTISQNAFIGRFFTNDRLRLASYININSIPSYYIVDSIDVRLRSNGFNSRIDLLNYGQLDDSADTRDQFITLYPRTEDSLYNFDLFINGQVYIDSINVNFRAR